MLDRSTIWPYEDGEPGDFYYQRYSHPAGAEAERRLGELEGGHALLFPSGAGATTALLLAFLEPGKTVALAKGAYFGTGRLMRMLERWGLQMVEFDQTGPPPDGADLVWVESPSNPLLTLPDLEAAAAYSAPLVVDSTASTPIYLRPLERGADFALHSATKFLGGHHDVLLGAVVCASEEHYERLKISAAASASSQPPIPPGSPIAACRRSRFGWSATRRMRRRSRGGSRRIRRSSASAIPASAASCRSTSPAALRPRNGSRPP